MEFWKQFKPKLCSVDLCGATKDATLAEIVELLAKGGGLSAAARAGALRALLERERLGSTGVGLHVAVPHVKLRGLDRALCSLAVHRAGVEWQALDGAPVHVVFTVLRPEQPSDSHDPERHLELMRWIARLARDGDFRRFAQQVRTKTELLGLLEEKSAV
jgi:mannitol/fructose-specific phosphotransferase system IIA component (Ntr-type)